MPAEHRHDSSRTAPASTATDPCPDAPDDAAQLRLRTALNRYLAARSAARSRADTSTEHELRRAKLGLVQLLAEAGWEPPPTLRAALEESGPSRRSA